MFRASRMLHAEDTRLTCGRFALRWCTAIAPAVGYHFILDIRVLNHMLALCVHRVLCLRDSLLAIFQPNRWAYFAKYVENCTLVIPPQIHHSICLFIQSLFALHAIKSNLIKKFTLGGAFVISWQDIFDYSNTYHLHWAHCLNVLK